MTMLKRNWIAAMILCLFMVLGIVYSVATPVLEASDELTTILSIVYLAGGNGARLSSDPARRRFGVRKGANRRSTTHWPWR